MVDRLTPEHRSWNMSRICGANTKPEKRVRSILHANGYRFRLHRKTLPGKPDIVLPKYNSIILVHGCFWHRHAGCRFAYSPKSRIDFWREKFARNVQRDKENLTALRSLDWKVMVVWECQTAQVEQLAGELRDFLNSSALSPENTMNIGANS